MGKNIDVKLNGRNITFIGYMFVDNKVKKILMKNY